MGRPCRALAFLLNVNPARCAGLVWKRPLVRHEAHFRYRGPKESSMSGSGRAMKAVVNVAED